MASRRISGIRKVYDKTLTTNAAGAVTLFTFPVPENGSLTIHLLLNVKVLSPAGNENWVGVYRGGGDRNGAGAAVLQGGGNGWNSDVRESVAPNIVFDLTAVGNNLVVTYDPNSPVGDVYRLVASATVLINDPN